MCRETLIGEARGHRQRLRWRADPREGVQDLEKGQRAKSVGRGWGFCLPPSLKDGHVAKERTAGKPMTSSRREPEKVLNVDGEDRQGMGATGGGMEMAVANAPVTSSTPCSHGLLGPGRQKERCADLRKVTVSTELMTG